jgi:hypothetical protein
MSPISRPIQKTGNPGAAPLKVKRNSYTRSAFMSDLAQVTQPVDKQGEAKK